MAKSPLLFLSHAGVDSEAALDLAQRIERSPEAQKNSLKIWIDKRDLSPGTRWKESLQESLQNSTAFVVYVGSKGPVNWVWYEVSVALDRAVAEPGYPLIPVLSAGKTAADLPGFLSQHQCVGDPANPAEFSKLLRAVLRLEPRAPVEAEREPFVGLHAYDSGSAHLFFGRGRETDELLGLLRDEHLVMVVGDSGSGKSSLVKAGVIPAFRGGRLSLSRPEIEGPDETIWYTIETRPGIDPFAQLADEIMRKGLKARMGPKHASELAEMVRQTPRNADRIRDALLASSGPDVTRPSKTLLVVDQFEELATSPDAQDYVSTLLRLADSADDQIRVVLTMRLDYYYLCASFKDLNERLEKDKRRARYLLQRMSPEGLRECVVRPLQLAGVEDRDCDAIADEVLRDVGEQAGELALLQMALSRTWSFSRENHVNLLDAYKEIGRVEGALAQAAEEVFGKLSEDEKVRAEALFVRLVLPGESGGAVRRIAQINELDEATQALARKLAEKGQWRLITVGEQTVEIAHEQLATQWLRYQHWIRNAPGDPRGDDLRTLQALIQDCSRWREAGGAAKHLARGHDIDIYRDLAAKRKAWLSDSEQGFVAASWKLYEEEEDKKQRAERKLRRLTAASVLTAVLALGLLGAGAYLLRLRNEARGATLATVTQLMLEQPVTDTTAPLIAALAATGWRLGKTSDAWNAMQRVPSVRIHTDIVDSEDNDFEDFEVIIPTPDGARVVTLGDYDGTSVVIWDSSARVQAHLEHDHGSRIIMVALSPGGETVATAGEDGMARLWAMKDGRKLQELPHVSPVQALAFSQDGKLLATSSKDGSIRLWDVREGRLWKRFSDHGDFVRIAMSKDASLLATASADGVIRIVSVADGHGVATIAVGEKLAGIAFSPDGGRLTIAESNGVTRIIAAYSGQEVARLGYDGPQVGTITLSPDGRFVATTSINGGDNYEVRIASVVDGREIILPPRSDGFTALGFSPDSKLLAVAEWESSGGGAIGSGVIWELGLEGSEDARLTYSGHLSALAVNHSGKQLAVASTDGTLRVVSVSDGRQIARTTLEEASPEAAWTLAFSGDGNLLSIVSNGGALQTMAVANSAKPRKIKIGDPDNCYYTATSPDGTQLLCVGESSAWVIKTPEDKLLREVELAEIEPDYNPLTAVAVTSDGTLIAVGQAKGDTLIFRAQDGAVVVRLRDRAPVALQFRHDGKLLATGSADGTIRLVEIPAGRELARIQQGGRVTAVAFSDSVLFTGDDRGNIRLWSTDLEAMLKRLCNSPGRNLSRTEWARSGYLNDLPWRPTCESWPTPEDAVRPAAQSPP